MKWDMKSDEMFWAFWLGESAGYDEKGEAVVRHRYKVSNGKNFRLKHMEKPLRLEQQAFRTGTTSI